MQKGRQGQLELGIAGAGNDQTKPAGAGISAAEAKLKRPTERMQQHASTKLATDSENTSRAAAPHGARSPTRAWQNDSRSRIAIPKSTPGLTVLSEESPALGRPEAGSMDSKEQVTPEGAAYTGRVRTQNGLFAARPRSSPADGAWIASLSYPRASAGRGSSRACRRGHPAGRARTTGRRASARGSSGHWGCPGS
jgi:hypothetical protein